jgi:hypothetical protein
MTQQFTPVEVGEFPTFTRGPKKKYITKEILNMLLENKGKIFLIAEVKNLGSDTAKINNTSTTMRNSGKFTKLDIEIDNPNLIFDYAVRQTVKEHNGVARMYARISEK